MQKIRVLFVCLGNICRSPMGEFILKDMTLRMGIGDKFVIASAGVSDEEEGNPVYPPARAELAAHGIDCSGKRAVQFVVSDYDRYDYILAMEKWHVQSIMRVINDAKHKVYRLLDFTDHPADIADPWYTRDFKSAYREIEEGCSAFINYLREKSLL